MTAFLKLSLVSAFPIVYNYLPKAADSEKQELRQGVENNSEFVGCNRDMTDISDDVRKVWKRHLRTALTWCTR